MDFQTNFPICNAERVRFQKENDRRKRTSTGRLSDVYELKCWRGPTCGSDLLELVSSSLEDGLSLLAADGLLHGSCALVPPQGLQVQVLVRVHPCRPVTPPSDFYYVADNCDESVVMHAKCNEVPGRSLQLQLIVLGSNPQICKFGKGCTNSIY